VALAREAARALRQLKAFDALAAGLESKDPEVRATAAAAGAAPTRLCAVLRADEWPKVRSSAARGLLKHPTQAACLADGFGDPDPVVALVSIQVAGLSGLAPLRKPLRRVAGSPRASVPLRGAAFVSLAHLGDAEPAQKALATHLASGKIVPLAVAAVRALAVVGDLERLKAAGGSESERVRKVAERALANAKGPTPPSEDSDPADSDPE
jgi:HEAT repeat protein